MTFLALIIALVLSLVWPYRQLLHHDAWFRQLGERLAGWGLTVTLGLVVQVGLPVAILSLLLDELRGVLFGLPWIAAASVVFLYALGRGNTGQAAEQYRSQCRRGDFEAAWHTAMENDPQNFAEGDSPQAVEYVHMAVQRNLLLQSLRGWFGVLFYFVLLGPAAALAYRLLDLGCSSAQHRSWMTIVDWIPSRLAALSFTVMGNFVESIDECYAGFRHPRQSARDLLLSVGRAAVGHDKSATPEDGFGHYAARQNEDFSALVQRAAVCWIVVISLWALAG